MAQPGADIIVIERLPKILQNLINYLKFLLYKDQIKSQKKKKGHDDDDDDDNDDEDGTKKLTNKQILQIFLGVYQESKDEAIERDNDVDSDLGDDSEEDYEDEDDDDDDDDEDGINKYFLREKVEKNCIFVS